MIKRKYKLIVSVLISMLSVAFITYVFFNKTNPKSDIKISEVNNLTFDSNSKIDVDQILSDAEKSLIMTEKMLKSQDRLTPISPNNIEKKNHLDNLKMVADVSSSILEELKLLDERESELKNKKNLINKLMFSEKYKNESDLPQYIIEKLNVLNGEEQIIALERSEILEKFSYLTNNI